MSKLSSLLQFNVKINLKIDWGRIGKRAAFGLSTVAAAAALKPDLLTSRSGLLSLAATGLAAAIPVAPGGAGLLRPQGPGTASLAQAVARTARALIAAPADRRRQVLEQNRQELQDLAVQAGEQAAIRLMEKTGQFSAGKLGQASTGQASTTDSQTSTADPAIASTGGNQ